MKKIFIIYLIASSLLLSCNKDDANESVFDKTAAERAEDNKQEFLSHLSSKNWVIEMFPTSDQRYGGYGIYADFNTDYTVELFNELNINTPGLTNYDIISRSGSVLTFNEFNDGIHFFSDPTYSIPEGFEGDYEFIYLKREDNVIYTKGIKTRNDIRFISTELTPADYFDKIEQVENLIADDSKILYLEKPADKQYKISLSGRTLIFTNLDDGETIEIPFIYRENGIRFYKPFTVAGVEMEELVLNDDKTALVSSDGAFVIKIGETLISFDDPHYIYFTNDGRVSQSALALFQDMYDKNLTVTGEQFNTRFFSFNYNGDKVLTARSSGNFLVYIFDVSYSAPDVVYFEFIEPFIRWADYPHSLFFLDTIEEKSPYKVEDFDSDHYKLTSISDSDFWFLVTK